eukprot:g20148.t1
MQDSLEEIKLQNNPEEERSQEPAGGEMEDIEKYDIATPRGNTREKLRECFAKAACSIADWMIDGSLPESQDAVMNRAKVLFEVCSRELEVKTITTMVEQAKTTAGAIVKTIQNGAPLLPGGIGGGTAGASAVGFSSLFGSPSDNGALLGGEISDNSTTKTSTLAGNKTAVSASGGKGCGLLLSLTDGSDGFTVVGRKTHKVDSEIGKQSSRKLPTEDEINMNSVELPGAKCKTDELPKDLVGTLVAGDFVIGMVGWELNPWGGWHELLVHGPGVRKTLCPDDLQMNPKTEVGPKPDDVTPKKRKDNNNKSTELVAMGQTFSNMAEFADAIIKKRGDDTEKQIKGVEERLSKTMVDKFAEVSGKQSASDEKQEAMMKMMAGLCLKMGVNPESDSSSSSSTAGAIAADGDAVMGGNESETKKVEV